MTISREIRSRSRERRDGEGTFALDGIFLTVRKRADRQSLSKFINRHEPSIPPNSPGAQRLLQCQRYMRYTCTSTSTAYYLHVLTPGRPRKDLWQAPISVQPLRATAAGLARLCSLHASALFFPCRSQHASPHRNRHDPDGCSRRKPFLQPRD